MSRAVRKKKLPDPVDVIDLTQDSPSNTSLRLSRSCTESTTSNIIPLLNPVLLENCDVVPITFGSDIENDRPQRPSNRRRINSQPTVVINLEETINIEDSPNKIPKNQNVPVLTESPKTQKALTCPICLENLADDKIKAMTTPCGHVFCYDCLKIITDSKKKCSLCQRAITFSKCIRLHI